METGEVFFTSQPVAEYDKNTDSEMADFVRRSTTAPHSTSRDNSHMVDLDNMETGDVVSVARTAAASGHSTYSGPISPIHRATPPTSPWDSNQIMDLDDTETGDVVFVSQVGAEDEHTPTADAADFVRRSTPSPYPISPRDNNRIMDLDDTETGDMVFTSQANLHGIDSETVSLICCLTSVPSDPSSG